MFRTVREYDTDKVSDCKEDIDTLLVFVRDPILFYTCLALMGDLDDDRLAMYRLVSTRQC